MSKIHSIALKNKIDLFDTLFSKRKNSEPRKSAYYFVGYILNGFGCSFDSILTQIQNIRDEKGHKGRRKLETGRENLIKDGLLSRVIAHNEIKFRDETHGKIFKREQYLPVNPRLIYYDTIRKVDIENNIFKEQKDFVDELYDHWKRNFNLHGFFMDKGILSVYCTAPWLLFSLLNFLQIWNEEEKTLYIKTSSTNWCKPPLISSLYGTIDRGLQLKVLLDSTKQTDELDRLIHMENVDIRGIETEDILTNRLTFIGWKYVVDMHKIIGINEVHSNYIATIYLNMQDVAKKFEKNFISKFKKSKSIT